MKEVRRYTDGIRKDISYDLAKASSMYHNYNFVVMNKDDEKIGALSTPKGNTLLFNLPDIPPVFKIIVDGSSNNLSISFTYNGNTYSVTGDSFSSLYDALKNLVDTTLPNIRILDDAPIIRLMATDNLLTNVFGTNVLASEEIPEQKGVKIIGGKSTDNYIVLFSTNETSSSPISSGQIWLLQYDSKTDTILNLGSNNTLTIEDHLVHTSKLNFSSYYMIGNEVILRNESDITLGCYFTDNYNEIRACNLLDKNLLLKSATTLGLAQDVSFSPIIPVEVTNTGLLKAGYSYQFFYRYLDTNGKYSNYSPGSVIVPLGSYDSNTSYDNMSGKNPANLNNVHAIRLEINNLDTNYDVIEIVAVMYSSETSYTAYRFYQGSIPSTQSINILHTGGESDIVNIDPIELTKLSSPFTVCKTLTARKGRLLAANTKSTNFDIDFDARAYRYNSNGECRIYKADKQTLEATFTGTNFPTDLTLDAYNKYNDEFDSNWLSQYQYKYQSDGITIGGEGPNVKYSFTSFPIQRRSNWIIGDSTDYHSTGVNDIGNFTINGNLIYGSGFPYNYKNPLISAHLTGLMGGEVYRIGLVFIDKKGNKSYVKWVGDIKAPDRFEKDINGNYLTLSGLSTRTIGLKLEINVSSINSEVRGVEVVYVKRTNKDKSVLGSGVTSEFDYAEAKTIGPTGLTIAPTAYKSRLGNIGGTKRRLLFTPGHNNGTNILALFSTLGYPSDPISVKSNDKLKAIEKVDVTFGGNTFILSDNTLASTQWAQDIIITPVRPCNDGSYATIDRGKLLSPLEAFSYSGLSAENASLPYGSATLSAAPGVGGYNLTLGISSFNSSNPIEWSINNSNYFEGVLASYRRKVDNQYGGISYESRSKNKYISTGYYFSIDESITTLFMDVWGFDTYVGELPHHACGSNPNGGDTNKGTISVAVMTPVESTINFTLWNGDPNTISSYDDGYYRTRLNANTGNGHWSDLTELSNIALRNTVSGTERRYSFFPYYDKDFLQKTTEIHPHRIWVSQRKLDGEFIDNWRDFRVNDYMEVDGNYGEINAIRNINDTVVYLQRQGVGRVFVEQQTIVPDSTGLEIVTGTGDVLGGYQYFSTQYGTLHKFSVVEGATGLHFIDALNKKWCIFNGKVFALSDNLNFSTDLSNIINGDLYDELPLLGKGIVGVRDLENNRIQMTFLGSSFTKYNSDVKIFSKGKDGFLAEASLSELDKYSLVVNESLNCLEYYSPDTSSLYIDINGAFLSIISNTAYVSNRGNYGEFNGNMFNSILIIRSSPKGSMTKVFDTLMFKNDIFDSSGNLIIDTFDFIQVTTENQDSGLVPITLPGNARLKMRSIFLNIPRDNSVNSPRIRGGYADIKLIYNNTDSYKFTLREILLGYRLSYK